ncbi:MAG: ABC transporter substrate-binding protein [Candidatus Bathyarchaeia archaeon]
MNGKGIAFRVKVIVVAVVIVVAAIVGALAYIYMAPKMEEEVRIGNIVSLTGVLSAWGQPGSWAMRKCVEDINKLGGITVGGRKLLIKFIEYDDSSDPTKATALAEQAIFQDKVHILTTPGAPPPTVIPISLVADKNKIPYISGCMFEGWWASGPYKYAWSIGLLLLTPAPEGDFRAGKPGYQALINYRDITNKVRNQITGRIALFCPDDAGGRTTYELASKVAQEAGFTVVGLEKRLGLYTLGTMDYTAIIREWMEAGADVLWGESNAPDFATMWRQAHALGWKPKMVMDGRAFKQYGDVEAMGKLAQGVIDPYNVWNPYRPYTGHYSGRTNMQLAEAAETELGRPWTDTMSAYSFIEAICQAIELAGSLDPEKINDAIPKIDFITNMGRFKFIPEFHFAAMLLDVGQWLIDEQGNLKWELVWSADPNVKPTHELVFPLP